MASIFSPFLLLAGLMSWLAPATQAATFSTIIVNTLEDEFNTDGDCSLINTDPNLGPLQDNGGPTWTHALLEGSPAIDAADPVFCPSADQRGETRPQDGDGDGLAIYRATSGTKTITVLASIPGLAVTDTHTITLGPAKTYLPLIMAAVNAFKR